MQTYIVVGAGILGASTSYHLAKQGAKVIIIDREDKGQATAAAAGIVCPWLTNRRNKEWYRLVKNGARYYPTLIQQLENEGEKDTGYANVGAINVFTGKDRLNQKYEFALERKENTPEMGKVKKLSALETNDLFPPLKDDYKGVFIGGAARINGRALRDALIRGAKRYGASYVTGDASLIMDGSKVTGAQVNGETYYADKVVITGGAWSKELLEPYGLKFLVTSQKAQIVHLKMPDTDTSSWPIVMGPFNQYMLGFKGGKIVVGSTKEDDAEDARPTVGGIHDILDKVLSFAPGLASCTYVETKVGFRPFTPDSLPVIGEVPTLKGVYVANGLGASGLTSGPYIGGELAKLVLAQEPEIDLKDYDAANAFGF